MPRHPGKNRCRVLSKPENRGKDKAGDANGNQKRNHARQDKRQEDGPSPKREQAVELYCLAIVDPRECAADRNKRDGRRKHHDSHARLCKLMRGVCGRGWPGDSQRQRDKPEEPDDKVAHPQVRVPLAGVEKEPERRREGATLLAHLT